MIEDKFLKKKTQKRRINEFYGKLNFESIFVTSKVLTHCFMAKIKFFLYDLTIFVSVTLDRTL